MTTPSVVRPGVRFSVRAGLLFLGGLGLFGGVAYSQPTDRVIRPTDMSAEVLLGRFDKNRDGKLQSAELPVRGRNLYLLFDRNRNGELDPQELDRLAAAGNRLGSGREQSKTAEINRQMRRDYQPDPRSGLYLDAARDYHKLTAGEALYVLKDGELIFEAYDNGGRKNVPHQLASGTKSFCGVVAACAVEDGLIGWDEIVADTVTEWAGDPLRSKITVRHLLSLSAGLPPETEALQGLQTRDKYAYAIAQQATHPPGEVFEYGPCQYFAFGEFLKRKLEQQAKQAERAPETIEQYFLRRIGEPIGIRLIWRKDMAGNSLLPHGIFATADQWAKLGEFVRMKGRMKGQQLLATALLDECFTPSSTNAGYGLTWWLGHSEAAAGVNGGETQEQEPESSQDDGRPDDGRLDDGRLDDGRLGDGRPDDLVFAAGKGGQYLFVSRKAGLTIVRFADDARTFQVRDFFHWLLRGKPADAE